MAWMREGGRLTKVDLKSDLTDNIGLFRIVAGQNGYTGRGAGPDEIALGKLYRMGFKPTPNTVVQTFTECTFPKVAGLTFVGRTRPTDIKKASINPIFKVEEKYIFSYGFKKIATKLCNPEDVLYVYNTDTGVGIKFPNGTMVYTTALSGTDKINDVSGTCTVEEWGYDNLNVL